MVRMLNLILGIMAFILFLPVAICPAHGVDGYTDQVNGFVLLPDMMTANR